MKRAIRILVFIISVSYCGITYSQNKYITLTSTDFIKGLDNIEYIRGKLIENGLTNIGKSMTGSTIAGLYECWQLKSLLYVDIIYKTATENTIKVGVHETFTGFPERLIRSFPKKNIGKNNEHIESVNVMPTNKTISYSLTFSKDTDNVNVFVWFDRPYYFFEYKHEK
jgi:hypothetical protein